MNRNELFDLIRWDFQVNRGWSIDHFRARLLLWEIRIEQYLYQKLNRIPGIGGPLWLLVRFLGSLYQLLLCSSNIPGTVKIGRGLRLPHPQNIVIAFHSEIGEFCTVYHEVSIVWNGFIKPIPNRPKIGDRVLIGTRALIVGDVVIGDDVLIGAGAIVPKSVPSQSRVTSKPAKILPRPLPEGRPEGGSAEFLRDPYSIWRTKRK